MQLTAENCPEAVSKLCREFKVIVLLALVNITLPALEVCMKSISVPTGNATEEFKGNVTV